MLGSMIALFILLMSYGLIKYGIPIALLVAGYFLIKGHKKRKVHNVEKPVAIRQENIKP